ncbi:EAL domain-containing protein [Methylonatrum kenyense]|uniref:bifunctional diguanylate cyclase/phosphodiesterase n=1 Tax=Methylonatrum kenyense TaxID=455253 RepID=UPI0020C05BC5|nr:EAL domain-containing protein [Methylonatrum kenyense]MCK8515610.1 EAL domain-containing protein [Methylonatrum kenyense]
MSQSLNEPHATAQRSLSALRDLVAGIPVPAVITRGAEQDLVFANGAFVDLTGYSLGDVATLDQWWAKAYPDSRYRRRVRAEWNRRIARANAYRTPIRPIEARISVASGEERYCRFHATAFGDCNLVILTDLTALRKTEATLIQRERYLSSLVASMQDVLFVLDAEGRFVECHAADEDDLAVPPDVLRGRHFAEYLPEDLSREMLRGVERVRGDGLPFRHSFALDVPNGEKHFIATVSSLDPAGPAAAGFLVVVQDITDQKTKEEALRQSEQRFRDIVDTANGIVWEADAGFQFTFISRQAETMLGYPREAWKSKDFWVEHMHPEDRLWAPAYCASESRALRPHDFEYRFIAADGAVRWLRDLVTVVAEDGQPKWLRGIMVDITEQREAQDVLAFQQRFQGLVAQISTQLINAGDTSFEATLQDVLRQLGEFFAVDRCYIAEYDDEAGTTALLCEWCAPGVAVQATELQQFRTDDFPWWEARVRAFEPISIADVRALPEEAYPERAALLSRNVRALVSLPLISRERVFGYMNLDILRSDEPLPEHQITLLRVVASAIAGAIERNAAEQTLRIAATAFESQEGMFVMDSARRILQANRAFTQLTGYSADDLVGNHAEALRSPRQSRRFYDAVWAKIRRDGAWQGEMWFRRQSGEEFLAWVTMTAVNGADALNTHYVGTLNDITQRKAAEEEIEYLAFFDSLTQLPNRSLLLDRMRKALSVSARTGRGGALLFIDLDNFKLLNDTLGHPMGDLFLQHVARRLRRCIRANDTLARLGGDEFVVMLENLSEEPGEAVEEALGVARGIRESLSRPYDLIGREQNATSSIGVAMFEHPAAGIEELMKRADLAMYQAKAEGRDTIRFFDPKLQASVMERADLETEMHQALREQQYLLHYQPKVDHQGRVTGAEALVRWQHPSRGLVGPGAFVPVAEEIGLILPIGTWVIREACLQLSLWQKDPQMAPLDISVNISARQFKQPGFVDDVLEALKETGADPRRLVLEITESLLLEDLGDIVRKMERLKRHGVGFSLDDFGTGYSSLVYLKRLPLDQLKIDYSFVRDALVDPNDAAIIHTIMSLGESLEIAVIAEGVETEEQHAWLAGLGCQAFQGYLFGAPVPADELFPFAAKRIENE